MEWVDICVVDINMFLRVYFDSWVDAQPMPNNHIAYGIVWTYLEIQWTTKMSLSYCLKNRGFRHVMGIPPVIIHFCYGIFHKPSSVFGVAPWHVGNPQWLCGHSFATSEISGQCKATTWAGGSPRDPQEGFKTMAFQDQGYLSADLKNMTCCIWHMFFEVMNYVVFMVFVKWPRWSDDPGFQEYYQG